MGSTKPFRKRIGTSSHKMKVSRKIVAAGFLELSMDFPRGLVAKEHHIFLYNWEGAAVMATIVKVVFVKGLAIVMLEMVVLKIVSIWKGALEIYEKHPSSTTMAVGISGNLCCRLSPRMSR